MFSLFFLATLLIKIVTRTIIKMTISIYLLKYKFWEMIFLK